MLVSLKSENVNPEFGFVVSKKIGNSVKRHKMTRRLRNISREMIKRYSLKSLRLQYILFKYSDDYSALFNEFEKQINASVSKWLNQ